MSAYHQPTAGPYVLAVSISPGGIPKYPQAIATATKAGLERDGRNHAKHIRPDRAVSLWDYEVLRQLVLEGFPTLVPGAAGENLTVVGLNVQSLPVGTLLRIGDVLLKLEQPRKPCYVLDAIDPRLKEAIVDRCGYLASVVAEGILRPGMPIEVILPSAAVVPPAYSEPFIAPLPGLVGRGSPDPAQMPTAGLPELPQTFAPVAGDVAGLLPGERSYLQLAGPVIG
jgi:MOSC domain-containing protein YiiM